ncbi:MAG: N-acetyltransferase family protein [Dehalococcoidia bacterium]
MAAEATTDRYPRTIPLRKGSANLRLMTANDGPAILAFAQTLSHDDLLFLRTDITSKAGVDEWLASLKKGNTIAVLAVESDAVMGYALFSRNPAQWTRRVGEIRVNVSPAKRGTGLGGALTREIFDVARASGLRKLTAQMTPDQTGARAMFEHLGFQPEALLADWVEDREGRTRDLLIMSYDLDGFTNTVG